MSRILVVDDNADNRYSMRLLLDGYIVIESASGEEGIRVARAERPDCILLDVRMPGVDGYVVCQELRRDDATRSIPIILVTAHDRDTQSVVRGLAAGADDYVTKPVAQEELLARVRAMLRVRDLQDQLEALNETLERQVRRRTEELRQIYATVPIGIYTLDAGGRVTSFNGHLETLLGYHADEVVHEVAIGALFGPDYDAKYWLDLCRREGHVSCETLAQAKDGRLFPVLDERVVNTDDVGERVGFTGYLMDLSRENRTRDLLAEQEKQAAIGQLTAGIIHEIANPIGGAEQYLDGLLKRLAEGETIPPSELRAGFEVVRTALQRTADLLQNLRRMGRFSVDTSQSVDLFVLLRDLRTLLRHSLERRGITMVLKGKPRTVPGDPGRLSQVFLNLITNARDAMPDGGTLTVEIGAEDSQAEVKVTDTGTGIDPENLDRVFQFLFTTKGERGTGYGLAISKDIVEEHGGRIAVESSIGQGSTFSVFLPSE